MAALGHASTHTPQSMHVSASTTARLPSILIASTGQDSTHGPQPEHLSASIIAAINSNYPPDWFGSYAHLARTINRHHERATNDYFYIGAESSLVIEVFL